MDATLLITAEFRKLMSIMRDHSPEPVVRSMAANTLAQFEAACQLLREAENREAAHKAIDAIFDVIELRPSSEDSNA